ncbi:MAG: hypothetical protein A3G33_10140 [Omnitrophica bacterium RIFCSPLOWO2_12_FULL_44_17]|uniref:PAS domain-containing protein n=1 Tax=Candidatus Danuiimicrobium aquiferis TaxID=1801832 RepID=A0A1G1L210_9BACT|nr:MAG: hypothetical protein A3B72_08470 [Omnitrophica bacterium RIFCSPHIGHO2_02_FULL_45_28]OGW91288.1 MAG: hypothetical protein A3E74_09985 [Omnitrophica bacterium RIFCSPHIGHO2_12_FULL_44_12]OGW99181.1 MAG: hypothetical protein A3G33_10140 [Omnitrophica bacterium RIFCSPLOWO2_12_FULL_44_17]OGX04403.1 MAG: hypothetical protein A3J12_00470 [Omnitrophica bacterium RIFCSPLOWO2_02_FULL_44_11]
MSKNKPYRFVLYVLLEIVRHVILILPRLVGYFLADVIGYTASLVLPKEQAKIKKNLRETLGSELTTAELNCVAPKIFINLAKTAVDVFQFPKLSPKRIEQLVPYCEGIENLEMAAKQSHGVIGLSAHIGNWELVAAFVMNLFPDRMVAVIARKIYYEPFDKVLVSLRKYGRFGTIYRDGGLRQIISVLKKNGIIGIVPDQDVEKLDSIFVDFLGRPAWTPTAPAKISLATGSWIVPMFMIHEKNHYRMYIEKPILPIENMPKEEAIHRMTEQWSAAVEKFVRRYPDQWAWMHNRWKTQEKPEEIKSLERIS